MSDEHDEQHPDQHSHDHLAGGFDGMPDPVPFTDEADLTFDTPPRATAPTDDKAEGPTVADDGFTVGVTETASQSAADGSNDALVSEATVSDIEPPVYDVDASNAEAVATAGSKIGRRRASDLLSRDEIKRLTQKNDLKAAWAFTLAWGLLIAVFAMVHAWTNPFTILLALILFGGRILHFAALMHDCGHRSMFTRPGVNDFMGQWLAASPILANLEGYRNNHSQHHVLAGTPQDPDLPNYVNYAVTRASFRRKILRDLTGRTGLPQAIYLIRKLWFRRLVGPVVINALMLLGCWVAGAPWLYLLWPLSYLTVYMLFSRIRNAAEHAVVPGQYDLDPTLHTRTTHANLLERLTVAPGGLNYHIEHHLLPTVPHWNLPEMHRLLKERGALERADVAPGYLNVIRRLVRKPEVTT